MLKKLKNPVIVGIFIAIIVLIGILQQVFFRYDIYQDNKLLYQNVRILEETDFTITFVENGKEITISKDFIKIIKK
jgi:putative effector of murein hydrolase